MSTVDLVIVIMRRGERRAGKLSRDRVKQILKYKIFHTLFFVLKIVDPNPPDSFHMENSWLFISILFL